MKEATYIIGTIPYLSWRKSNSDIEKICLTGNCKITDIEDLAKEFVYTCYKEITLDKLNIECIIMDYDKKEHSFEDYLYGDIYHQETQLSPLHKLIFNSYGNTSFAVVKDTIYSQDGKTLIHTPESTELIIDSYIEHIGNYCCCNYESLTKLTLPEGLKSIGKMAFCACEITELSLPNSVISIGEESFCRTEIEKLQLSANLQSLPDGCFSLTLIDELNIPASVKSIGFEAFHCVPFIECIKIPEGVESIDSDAFCSPAIVCLPSTLKEIARDFYYEYPVGNGDKPPYIRMNPANPIFYSKDGSLYYKATGELALNSKYNGLDERMPWSCKPPCIQ